jgi:manganese-dependent inorganic pyrophosphatase
VDENGIPVGLITGLSLFNFLARLVGPHAHLQEMRIAEILELSCREACDTNVPCFQSSTRIRDVINRILREEHNDFLVVNEKGLYAGVCHQRDVLNPPRLRLILVDHNEPSQALGSLDEAELVEILDHHRLGNHSTHLPIRFTVDVVGSTSTLVSERIEEAGLRAPSDFAGLLLSGLLSDTLFLASPTTTDRDRRAAERLGRWAFIRNGVLAGETIQSFGHQLLEAATGLSRDPEEIVSSDLKLYEAGSMKFAISQVEVTDMMMTEKPLENLNLALNNLRDHKGLDFAMLMVTDVVGGSSRLLVTPGAHILDDLPYPHLNDGSLRADGVVSRKKQLLPVVLGLLESL